MLRPNPGGLEATQQAIAEAQRRNESLDGHCRVWSVIGGPATGNIQVDTTVSGWEALGRLADRNQAQGPGPPQVAALQANPPFTQIAAWTAVELPI